MSLVALNFYEVMVDEARGQIHYNHLIESRAHSQLVKYMYM